MASPVFIFVFVLSLLQLFFSSSEILVLPLTHSLSKTQFRTTHHLLKSTALHSKARFWRKHHRQNRNWNQNQNQNQNQNLVSLPLSPGSDYVLSLSLGSDQAQPISLYMDTGSDLVWFPCSPFECILCEGKENLSTPLPKISVSRAVSCHSKVCSSAHSAHSAVSSSNLCAIARCPLDMIETSDCSSFSCPPFYYAYGDGSLIAHLYEDSFSIPMSYPALVLQNFTFGCAHSALGEPIGVAGFGRGLLSMPSQLARLSPQLGTQFSYCLVSHSFDRDRVRRPSPLILGRRDEKQKKSGDEGAEYVYTSMLDNPKHPYFYCVGLEAISVGKTNIPAPDILKRVDKSGGGGLVVDSGTTFTMLPTTLYNSVVAEFDNRVGQVQKRASEIEDKTGLSPCYYLNRAIEVPTMTLHFAGKRSSVVLPRKNYFYEFLDGGDGAERSRNVGCLMLINGGDEEETSGGPAATLGNYQQQGFEVVYDLKYRRVGFARRKCSLLWDSLN